MGINDYFRSENPVTAKTPAFTHKTEQNPMKSILHLLLTCWIITLPAAAQSLKISSNKRYIQTSEGKPFLWLGDTAWELFHRLNREEATEYLTTRARQGFTVIQAVALAENDGLRVPNAYGDLPLLDLAPDKPNPKYFQHVDFIVDKANQLGLYVGFLPTWGDKMYSRHPGAGPLVFTVANAETYGEFLGKRYKNKKVVWILGGDRNIDSDEVMEIWRAMARGLKKGDGGAHLIGYHPRGIYSSSEWLHNEDWLDFNIYQSGHQYRFNKVYEHATRDYLKQPAKPVLDGEPAYEDIPVKFWEYCNWNDPKRVPAHVLDDKGLIKDRSHFKDGFFTDYDIRIHAYWDLLSGAAGYTYGHNAVWQMFKPGGYIAIPALTDWREALNRKGANKIRHIRNLFEKRSIGKLIPDQSIIYGHNRSDSLHIRAASTLDGKSLLVYLSVGQPVDVVMKKVTDATVVAQWYDPRTGEAKPIGEFTNQGIRRFTPPTQGRNNDWVLVLDGKRAGLAKLDR